MGSPALSESFLFNPVPETTLSYASIMGLLKDLRLTGSEYSWLATVFSFDMLEASLLRSWVCTESCGLEVTSDLNPQRLASFKGSLWQNIQLSASWLGVLLLHFSLQLPILQVQLLCDSSSVP